MKIISIFIITLLVQTLAAQELKPGEVVVVSSETDPNEKYSVFVPANYTAKKEWPIIYTFSPGGGDGGMGRYKKGAAELGWLVVSSHNSRNGRDNRKTQKIIWEESHKLLSIDDERLYVSGMSGAARESLYFMLTQKEQFAGIISCGAFRNPNVELPKKSDTYFLMVAGKTDYNYAELIDHNNLLKARKIKSELLTFHGGHAWANKDLLAHCMRLFELHNQARQKKPNKKRCAVLVKVITDVLEKRAKDNLFWHESYVTALDIVSQESIQKYVKPLEKLVKQLEKDPKFDKEVASAKAFDAIKANKNDSAPEMSRAAKAYMEHYKQHPDTSSAMKALSVTKSMLSRAKQAKKYFGGKKGDAYNGTIAEIEGLLNDE